LKKKFKNITALNRLNAAFKSYCQERRAKKSLEYYCRQASKNSKSNIDRDVYSTLRKRFVNRGINPVPRKKGELHTFLTFSLGNWERALPFALAPFGKVTVFEWHSLGFNDRSSIWLKHRDQMNAEMLKSFSRANLAQPVDAVIGYLSGYNTDPKILAQMAKDGAIIFNFCWDDKLSFRGKMLGGRWAGPAALAPVVDLNLTNAPESCVKYLVEGGLAMFWPEAAHPDFHKPYGLPFEFDVSFVGGKYGWRPRFIKKLQKMNIKVTTFGRGWENGPLSDEEMVKLYSCSRINLGFAGVGHSRRLMCLKGRDFEVPMSGGLYLSQDNPELSLAYNVGKEIVTYRNEKDCAEKIKWLLANPEEADKIRKAGRKRALSNHTWGKRFADLFEMTGILAQEVKE